MQSVRRAAAAACLAGLAATPAAADTTVLGGGFAQTCSEAATATARRNDPAPRPAQPIASAAMDACDTALSHEVLKRRDVAATYVNRGILRMASQGFALARADFERALKVMPALPEARVNLGAALIAQRHFQEGLAEITAGLELGPVQPEKAYFNRAIAHEALGDVKSAYFDYKKASELDPAWAAPQKELTRFMVSQR